MHPVLKLIFLILPLFTDHVDCGFSNQSQISCDSEPPKPPFNCSVVFSYSNCVQESKTCLCPAPLIARGYGSKPQDRCAVQIGSTCPGINSAPCVPFSTCQKGVCICAQGYLGNPAGTECLAGFNMSCAGDDDVICNEGLGLKCFVPLGKRSGRCECPPKTSIWSAEKKKCLRKVNEYCVVGNDTCTPRAKCEKAGSASTIGLCKCEAGYSRTVDEACKLNRGMSCLPRNTPGLKATEICNPRLSLDCVNGKCDTFLIETIEKLRAAEGLNSKSGASQRQVKFSGPRNLVLFGIVSLLIPELLIGKYEL